ncbi:MAG: hypothetical protein ABSC94_08555 [Polyangiaceae bacterium]|jgi:hypothetical protein
MTIPRLSAPRAFDEVSLRAAAAFRAQSAIVRTLLDALERFTASGDTADGLREQIVEELDRLRAQEGALAAR